MAQAIWADEFARSVPDIEEDDDGDLWHVRMSSDDVKVLSLTRLDDMFRLSLVDAETLVWQPGMKNWVPLGVVAGMEDDSEPVTTVPRPPTKTHPAPPRPVPPRPVVQPLEPFGLVSAPQPLPVVPKPVAPVAIKYQVPESTRPITISEIYSVERGGGFGRFLLGLALVAGLAVTLYRNDVVRNMAHSARLDTSYAKLEQALGGPSFGTLRAVERVTQSAALSTAETPTAEPAVAATEKTMTAAAISLPTEKATPTQKPTTSEASPAVVSLDSLPVEKEKGAAAATKEAAPVEKQKAAAPVAKAARVHKASPVVEEEPEKPRKPSLRDAIKWSITPNAKFKPAPKKKKKGSDFDPLNGSL